MKKLLLLLLCLPLCAAPAREPLRLIFDTDIGNDIDDALALAMLHAFQDRGECQLLAVTITKDNALAVSFVDLINTFYGHGAVSIGRVQQGKTPEAGKFLQPVVEARDEHGALLYPRRLAPDAPVPEAVMLLRKTLAAQPDGSVAMVQVGFFTNLARLLDSPPDEYSPLTGCELVARKVKLLSLMAGHFTTTGPLKAGKYNIVIDIPAAQKVFSDWPTPIYVSPWELGAALKYPAISIARDYSYVPHHPVAEGYRHYLKFPYDRPTWDLTSVLYAVRPERDYFAVSDAGKITVDATGKTQFAAVSGGKHFVISATLEQKARVLEAMIELASQPPVAK